MKILIAVALLPFLVPLATAQATDRALLAKLPSPDHRVQSVAFSPDGKLIAAVYGFFDDGGITIWNTADRSIVATLQLNKSDKAGIKRLAFSDDGKLLAATTDRGD